MTQKESWWLGAPSPGSVWSAPAFHYNQVVAQLGVGRILEINMADNLWELITKIEKWGTHTRRRQNSMFGVSGGFSFHCISSSFFWLLVKTSPVVCCPPFQKRALHQPKVIPQVLPARAAWGHGGDVLFGVHEDSEGFMEVPIGTTFIWSMMKATLITFTCNIERIWVCLDILFWDMGHVRDHSVVCTWNRYQNVNIADFPRLPQAGHKM